MKSQKKCGAVDEPKEDVMIEKTVVVSMMGEAEGAVTGDFVLAAGGKVGKVEYVEDRKSVV